jgi:hypothetical protein
VSRVNDVVKGVFRRLRKKLTPAQQWVIVLSLLVLVLGLTDLARAALALRYNSRLPNLPLTAPLTYLAATAGFWGLVFVVCAVGLARFRRWGRWGMLAAVVLYEVHVWINRLLFDASDYAFQTRPRDLALTLLLLTLVWVPLNLPSIRRIFETPLRKGH